MNATGLKVQNVNTMTFPTKLWGQIKKNFGFQQGYSLVILYQI
jgi:hypothetical protein